MMTTRLALIGLLALAGCSKSGVEGVYPVDVASAEAGSPEAGSPNRVPDGRSGDVVITP